MWISSSGISCIITSVQMLENLVIAVESESQIVDLGRVSGFMQKVRDGII